MRTAALFSVGNSAGGCEFGLRWILRETGQLPHAYFFYGQAFPGQAASPLSVVHGIRNNPEFEGLPPGGECATHPDSLDRAYGSAREFLRTVEAEGYDRIYVGITGGTNPMVAGLFHAAMSELTGEVIPIYVHGKPGAEGQQSLELIPGRGTRDAILTDQVLGLARKGQLAAARAVAEGLPERGRGGFVRSAITALARWDNFDYQVAAELVTLAERSRDLEGHAELSSLAGTVKRYATFANSVSEVEAVFRSPEKFAEVREKPGWEKQAENRAYWLPLDALANGWRRLEEGRATDAVLRAYRAVETAIHCRLFAAGVHASALEWERGPLTAVSASWPAEWGPLPKAVAMEHALRLLGLISGRDFGDCGEDLRRIQHCRNYSYLEHGYLRVKDKTGRGILKAAEGLVGRILWSPRREEGARLKMEF